MDKLRVVIADDHLLICDGIRIILESQPDIAVAAIAHNGREAVDAVLAHNPDVVLMDIQMPEFNGIEALKEIKAHRPQTVVLMLTTFDPDEFILASFRNGADGYLMKDMSGDRLALAIRDAHAGNATIPVSIAARLIAQIPVETRRKSLENYGLTTRERKIADMIAQGYSNDMIAQTVGISMGTAKNYISTIYSKLEVVNRQQARLLITSLKGRGQGGRVNP